MTLVAPQCMDSKELNSFLFVQHPQIGSAYVTEGKMTLKYRSKREFLGKKRLHTAYIHTFLYTFERGFKFLILIKFVPLKRS